MPLSSWRRFKSTAAIIEYLQYTIVSLVAGQGRPPRADATRLDAAFYVDKINIDRPPTPDDDSPQGAS